ncbi:MAG: hypothetical protein AAF614_44215 [Chloroflexota bacterium]
MINFNDIRMAEARYQEMVPSAIPSSVESTVSKTAVFSFSNALTKLGQQLQGARLSRANKSLSYR